MLVDFEAAYREFESLYVGDYDKLMNFLRQQRELELIAETPDDDEYYEELEYAMPNAAPSPKGSRQAGIDAFTEYRMDVTNHGRSPTPDQKRRLHLSET
jgi:hypothetical protein